MNRLSLIEKIAGLVCYKMWQKFPEKNFYTTLTPVGTDEIFLSMIKKGLINPSEHDNEEGYSLLHITVMKARKNIPFYCEFLRALVKAGADVNGSPKLPVLKMAISQKKPSEEILKTLLELGADANFGEPLLWAVRKRNITLIKILLDAGAKPDEALEDFITYHDPLGFERDYEITDSPEDMEIVNILLNAGADANCLLAKLDIRSFRRAASEKITEILLDAGADINVMKAPKSKRLIEDRQTLLHRVIYYPYSFCNTDYINMLLKRGANVNTQDKDGYTPLMSACAGERGTEIITALLDAEADIDAQNNRGETALYLAAKKNDLDAFKLLLERGADPNISDMKNNTPLMKAIITRHDWEYINLLLEAGADTNIVNSEGDTALTLALARYQHSWNIVLSLMEKGADVNFIREHGTIWYEKGFDYETPFMILARRALWDDDISPACRMLQRYNPDINGWEEANPPMIDVNAKDHNGDTALIKAIRYSKAIGWQKEYIIRTLLNIGCDKNIANNEGKSALYYEIEKFTLKKALDGETVLMTFARTYRKGRGLLDGLLTSKDNPTTDGAPAFMVNAQDANGDTALIKAVRDNNCKIEAKEILLKTLLAIGADKSITNNHGKIAADYAETKEIINLLENGGEN